MKTFRLFIPFILIVLISHACKNNSSKVLIYPETKKIDTLDDYFSHSIADPYRWLEDNNSDDTRDWIDAQNKVCFSYLDRIPFRDAIKDRITQLWSYPSESSPLRKGDKLFYHRHDGFQNHSILYVKDINDDIEKVLIDPNLFSDDGTSSLAITSVSKDGKYVAYGISSGGSDWRDVYIREVDSVTDLDDHLQWVKFSNLSWDNDGFFYSRYDEPLSEDLLSASNEYQKVYYHHLGTSQDEDILIYQNQDQAKMNFSLQVDDESHFLLLFSSISTQGNSLMIKDHRNKGSWLEADNDFETENSYVTTVGDKILVKTNYDAARYQLMAVDPKNPSIKNWKTILAETGNVLSSVVASKNYLIAHYIEDVKSVLKVFSKKGEYLYDISLPGLGSASGLRADIDEDILYYSFASYIVPTGVFKFDLKNREQTAWFIPEVDFDSEAFEINQVFVEAEDGAEIPLFIVHKSKLELNGSNPTILYGYGGFNIIPSLGFDPRLIPWLENGGVYVCAHIRGGGEYGEGWYRGGTRFNKQRVFDDFILGAEYLIDKQYTNNDKLAIMGGSNGGLLVGAVANQRPELFKVALPAVGVMDMLRYHNFTIGWAWAGDYGRSDDSEAMFKYLYSYSPLHNIKESDIFPATLVTTADHDDRVVPAHSFKYIATLQEKYKGENPVLIRIETLAGHGAGKPLSMQIEEAGDKWAFALFNMNETWKLSKK